MKILPENRIKRNRVLRLDGDLHGKETIGVYFIKKSGIFVEEGADRFLQWGRTKEAPVYI